MEFLDLEIMLMGMPMVLTAIKTIFKDTKTKFGDDHFSSNVIQFFLQSNFNKRIYFNGESL